MATSKKAAATKKAAPVKKAAAIKKAKAIVKKVAEAVAGAAPTVENTIAATMNLKSFSQEFLKAHRDTIKDHVEQGILTTEKTEAQLHDFLTKELGINE